MATRPPPRPQPRGGTSGAQGGRGGTFGLVQGDDGVQAERGGELAVAESGAEPGLEEPLQA